MSITSFIGGMKDREESDLRKRQEMAKAFSTFKQANPHASFDDYQSFIDQMSGGRNYLRGGAPSQEVLKGLASQNAKTKAHDNLMRQSTAMRERAQLMGTIDAQIDQFMSDIDPNDPDYVGAYNRFAAQYGPEMAPLLEEMGVARSFSPQRHQKLISEKVAQNLPRAMEVISALGGEGDPTQLATTLNIPLFIATPLFEKAKVEKERKNTAWRTQNMSEILRLAQDDIASGDTDLQSVRTIAEAQGITLSDDFLKSTAEKASRQKQQQDLTWLTQNRRAIYDELDEAIKLGATDINPIIDRITGASGVTLSPEYRKQLSEGYGLRIKEREDAKQRELNDRMAQQRGSLRDRIENNPRIQSLISEGRIDEARTAMGSLLGDLPADLKEAAWDDLFDEITGTSVAVAQGDQDRERDAARIEFERSTTGINENVITMSQETAGTHFGDGTRTTPNTGPAGGNAALAAQDLARTYFMSGAALDTLQAAFANAKKDTTRAELNLIGAAALKQAGTKTVQEQQKSTVAAQRRALGITEDDMTFQQWQTSWEEDVNDAKGKIETALGRAMAETDPTRRARMLAQLKSGVQERAVFYKTALKNDQENSRRLITRGTAPWDNGIAAEKGRFADTTFSKLDEQIEAEMARLQEQGVSAEKAATTTKITGATTLDAPPADEKSYLGKFWDNLTTPTANATYSAGYRKLFDVTPNVMQGLTPTQRANFKKMETVYADPFTSSAIMSDPEANAAFAEDPIAFFQSDFMQELIRKSVAGEKPNTSSRNGGDRSGR